ncbi:MAG: type VI secretion system tube protein Hcp [Opitutales bacterium]
MKTSLLRQLGSLLILTWTVIPCAQGQAMYLRLDSVKGSATAPAFKDQMVVLDFSYAITTSDSTGVATGKATPGNLVMTKTIDISTPVLAQAAATGQPFQQAILSVTLPQQGEQKTVYTITLSNVRVVGVSQTGTTSVGHFDPLTEKVSLNYASIVWAYGFTKSGYNFSTNQSADVPDDSDSDSDSDNGQ